jgi:saccharopine dehydrogenase-like NADP-dependent oxidoreductase
MSLNIMIGSDPQDYTNIKNTIHFLDAILELKPLGFMDDEQLEVLNELIDWYKSMHDVLTNPALGSEELYNPVELTS